MPSKKTTEEVNVIVTSFISEPYETGTINITYGSHTETREEDLFWKPIESTARDIIIALQYWDGDVDRVETLLKELTDIQPDPYMGTVLLVGRNDARAIDAKVIQYARRAFPRIENVRSTLVGKGHPDGCNKLWAYSMMIGSQRAIRYGNEFILTMEWDCVPLRAYWINALKNICASNRRSLAIGHRVQPSTACRQEHINGNALFSFNLLNVWPTYSNVPSREAWDVASARVVLPRCTDTILIRSDYRRTDITDEELDGLAEAGCVFLHGIIDDNGLEWLRNKKSLK